jgi:hypothetical protein
MANTPVTANAIVAIMLIQKLISSIAMSLKHFILFYPDFDVIPNAIHIMINLRPLKDFP